MGRRIYLSVGVAARSGAETNREDADMVEAKKNVVRGHGTYTSDAGCVACKLVTGKLVVTVDTLFGIEEDERVLGRHYRVY